MYKTGFSKYAAIYVHSELEVLSWGSNEFNMAYLKLGEI